MAAAAVALPADVALPSLRSSASPRRRPRPPQQRQTRTEKDFGLEVLEWRIGQALSSARFLAALAQEQDTRWRDGLRRAVLVANTAPSKSPSHARLGRAAVVAGEEPPAYEETLDDAPPDYTDSDALATAALIAAPLDAPPPSFGPLSAPLSPPSPSIGLLEKDRVSPKVDFSNMDNVREHAKKKKKAAQKTTAAWAQSDDEGDKKKDEGAAGDGGDGGGGGADGGDNGGGDGGGGDENGGGGDDGDDWNDAGGKKNKKKKKGKTAEEEEEEKKAEEEAAAIAAADAGANDAWGDTAGGTGDANPDDEWGGFTTAKKKKKKGKVSITADLSPASSLALLHVSCPGK